MPVTLPLEVYEVFEKIFGKEDAKAVIKSLEAVIGNEIINKWHQTKEELKEELLKEVPTKLELENVRIELIGKINELHAKMEKDKIELLGKIENTKIELLGKTEKDKAEILGKTEKDKAELTGKIEKTREELIGKIETEIARLDRKFTIMFVILFFTIIFLNQNALEFIAKVIGLVR
ncbi:MAG: hypothetical protein WHS38_12230 [Thermodesulforhabdaceae bacterium]|jgi:hypothetical protein